MNATLEMESLPILQGRSNYRKWATTIKWFFKYKQVWHVVTATENGSDSVSDWESKDGLAMYVMVTKVSEEILEVFQLAMHLPRLAANCISALQMIGDMESAAAAWAFLKTLFGQQETAFAPYCNYLDLLTEFKKNAMDTEQFIHDYVKLVKAVDAANSPNDWNLEKIMKFVGALEEDMPEWVEHIKSQWHGKDFILWVSIVKFEELAGQALMWVKDYGHGI